MSSSGMGRDVVHPAFPLPTMASQTFQGATKDCFGDAVVASQRTDCSNAHQELGPIGSGGLVSHCFFFFVCVCDAADRTSIVFPPSSGQYNRGLDKGMS